MIHEIKTSDLVVDFQLDRSTDYVVLFDSGDETQSDAGSTKRTPISAFDASVWSVSANYNIDKLLPVYTTVNANSGIWASTNATVNGLSANWNSNFTSVNGNSANWNSVYTHINGVSAKNASNYTTVKSYSANWNSVYNYVNGVSARNASNVVTVNSNSANWNGYQSNSATIFSGIAAATNALSGGTTNQILTKTDSQDGHYAWRNKRIVYSYDSITTSQSLTFNALSADQFIVPLSGASPLTVYFTAPVSAYDGQMLMWDVRHVTANTTVSLCSDFRLPTASLSWSTLSGKMDIMAAKYNLLDSKWDVVSFLPGFNI